MAKLVEADSAVYTKGMTERSLLIATLFPLGVPTLWCPPLTHFRPDGTLDRERIRAQLRFMRPYVPALLVPGSTSEGWELSRQEEVGLIDIALDCAREMDFTVLVGMLRPAVGAAKAGIEATVDQLFGRARPDSAAFFARHLCGFAVTAPKGKELSQSVIHQELEAVLALGYPTAFYQLPQITENEIAPETVADLALRYQNLYLLKDTSGGDRVVTSGLDFDGVFFVRGAEGDYAKWYTRAGGLYDGFLLSSANCFPHELREVLDLLEEGRTAEADALSLRISNVVLRTLAAAAQLPFGNQFTNAAKAIDHFVAEGPEADLSAKIYVKSGATLPRTLLETAREALIREGLMPHKAYR